MEKGKKFLSDLKLYSDYLKWKDDRYETWEEACEDIISGHIKHYNNEDLNRYLEFALKQMKSKNVLASQRSLQYRNEQIEKHNARLYNCSTIYAARPRVFQEVFYLSLCGCGVGIGLLLPFVNNLPRLQERTTGTETFYIEDNIESWADALGVLMSSYFSTNQPFPQYAGKKIKFDYSRIRPEGSYVSGGFKAPGSEGLRKALNNIEKLLDNWIKTEGCVIRPILVCDILCFASEAVLSGGIRRSAMCMIVDINDEEMINAKTGNWWIDNPQRSRTNNSVLLLRNETSKEQFDKIISLNNEKNDIGFAFANSWFDMFNPCFEILQHPIAYKRFDKKINELSYNELEEFIKDHLQDLGVSFCNLTEINAENCTTEEKFIDACKAAAILGTVQCGYNNFDYLGDTTKEIVQQDSLLGISITGWMNNTKLFNEEWLEHGVKVIKETNKVIGNFINVSPAARLTCVKPSGNSSVILGTASGIHPEHAKKYFRIMRINKSNEIAKWLNKNMSFLLEDALDSQNNSDYAIFIPIENNTDGLYKQDLKGIKHLELIKFVQENWVNIGVNEELGAYKGTHHNTSNTVIIDNLSEMIDYIWDNREYFTAVSFVTDSIDKDYNQAPYTSILAEQELMDRYGRGVLFASGLIVDGLHYFNENLWAACDLVKDRKLQITGTKEQIILKKYWISRVKKFANNYFGGDLQKTIYCLKDLNLLHKWEVINRQFKTVKFNTILTKPEYKEINHYSAQACNGNSCEILHL